MCQSLKNMFRETTFFNRDSSAHLLSVRYHMGQQLRQQQQGTTTSSPSRLIVCVSTVRCHTTSNAAPLLAGTSATIPSTWLPFIQYHQCRNSDSLTQLFLSETISFKARRTDKDSENNCAVADVHGSSPLAPNVSRRQDPEVNITLAIELDLSWLRGPTCGTCLPEDVVAKRAVPRRRLPLVSLRLDH